MPTTEEWSPDPVSPYGVAKLAAERYCVSFSRVYESFESVVLRFPAGHSRFCFLRRVRMIGGEDGRGQPQNEDGNRDDCLFGAFGTPDGFPPDGSVTDG